MSSKSSAPSAATSTAVRLFPTASTSERDKLAQNIYDELATRTTTLHALVAGMEPLLVSVDPNARVQGLELLTSIVSFLKKADVSSSEVDLLLRFYVDRLMDLQSCKPCLEGLLCLLNNHSLSKDQTTIVVAKLFAEINTQTLRQPQRSLVFKIFESLLTKYILDIKSIEKDFIFGFIQAMDGEKDPRNLILLFKLATIITLNLDFSRFTEDLFEISWCYFPITYNPPPNDSSGITREDLRSSLNDFLSSTGAFAEFTLPNLIEKLSSSIEETKLESYNTLEICAPIYASHLSLNFDEIWEFMKTEIFDFREEKMIRSVISCLKSCLNIMWPCDALFEKIIETCKKHIDGESCEQVGKLLTAISYANQSVTSRVTTIFFPKFIENLKDCKIMRKRHHLLEVIVNLLKVSNDMTLSSHIVDTKELNEIVAEKQEHFALPFYKDLLELFMINATDEMPSIRSLSLFGLITLVNCEILTVEELNTVVPKYILAVIINECDANVRKTIIASIPNWIFKAEDIICSSLETFFSESLQFSKEKLEWIFWLFGEMGSSAKITVFLVPRLLSLLTKLKPSIRPNVLSCLNYILLNLRGFSDSNVVSILKGAAPLPCKNLQCDEKKTATFVDCSFEIMSFIMANLQICEQDDTLIIIISRCLINICRLFSPAEQEQLLALFDKFLNDFSDDLTTLENEDKFKIVLLTSILGNTKKETKFDLTVLSKIYPIPSLFSESSTSLDKNLVLSSNKGIGCVLNSRFKDPHCQTIFHLAQKELIGLINTGEISQKKAAADTLIYITKALVISNEKCQKQFVDIMIGHLDSLEIGAIMCDGFRIIVEHDELYFNKHSFANTKFMYRQRLFTQTKDQIISLYRQTADEKKAFYLGALSHMLCQLPTQVLVTEIPLLFPILVDSIKIGNLPVKISTVKTITYLTTTNDATVLTSELVALIPALLDQLHSTSMELRRDIVIFFSKMTKLPYHEIHPFKRPIIDALGECLDDRKRLVRQEAVKSRGLWYQL